MEKKPIKSKTIWMGVITAVAAFFPPVHEFIVGNPEAFAAIVGALFIGLRVITKDKIVVE